MTQLTSAQITALASEITTDPSDPKVGYAAFTAIGSDSGVLSLLNALTTTMPQAILMAKVLTWGAETGVRARIEANLASATVVTIGSATTTLGAICLSVKDMLQGSAAATLDTTDPKILAMLDVLVANGVLVNTDGTTSAKPSLITLGTVPASRPMALGIVPFGTLITLGDISMALRGD